jgi:hypothetical protein
MIVRHYMHLPSDADWHTIVDDFGNESRICDRIQGIQRNRAWAAAYRFANGQSFEQAGMRSIGAMVEEH